MRDLIAAAARAEELIDHLELEAYADAERKKRMHWHLMSGSIGCLSDYSEMHDTEEEARDGLAEYMTTNVCMTCMGQTEDCKVEDDTDRIDAPIPGQCGFEYVEICSCSDDCLVREAF